MTTICLILSVIFYQLFIKRLPRLQCKFWGYCGLVDGDHFVPLYSIIVKHYLSSIPVGRIANMIANWSKEFIKFIFRYFCKLFNIEIYRLAFSFLFFNFCNLVLSVPLMGEDGKLTFTVDDALSAMGFGKFQILVLAYAGMGWISEAMEMMLLSFIGPAVQSLWGLSSHEESLITSVVFVGMLVGAYSWGVVSDKHGRR